MGAMIASRDFCGAKIFNDYCLYDYMVYHVQTIEIELFFDDPKGNMVSLTFKEEHIKKQGFIRELKDKVQEEVIKLEQGFNQCSVEPIVNPTPEQEALAKLLNVPVIKGVSTKPRPEAGHWWDKYSIKFKGRYE